MLIVVILAVLVLINPPTVTYADSLDAPEDEPVLEEIIEHDHVIIYYLYPTATTHEVWEREVLINTATGEFIVTDNWAYLRTENHHFILVNYMPGGDLTEGYEYHRICNLCGYMEIDR